MAEEAKKKRGRPKKEKVEKVEKVEAEIVSTPKKGGVGGNGNLKPMNQRTKEEQRAIASAGGKASVEARRKKKELREFTRDFLMQEAAVVLKQNMSVFGVEAQEMSNLAAMVTRLFSKAVNQGDLNAARTIIEWAGMAPMQEIRENEAVARLSQVMQLAQNNGAPADDDGVEDVIFYIPDNNRPVIVETKEEKG